MAKIIIFGVNDFAQLAHFYFTNDSAHKIVAFCVDKEYLCQEELLGLPVIPFEGIDKIYHPNDHKMFVPISPAKMNLTRELVYTKAMNLGYSFVSYISSKATYYGTPVGDNCFIFENNVIQPFTSIGNNVIIWSGNHIGHHSTIGDHTFISSHVVISGHVKIGRNCFLGVNATVNNGVAIANHNFIGSGALISRDTQEYQVYKGLRAELAGIPSNKLKVI